MSRQRPGFAFSAQFQQIVEDTLSQAKRLGASDAGGGLRRHRPSVSVRKGELENVERNRDKSLGVSVYLGQRRGNASTSDFSAAAIARTPCRRPTTSPASPPRTRPPACPTRRGPGQRRGSGARPGPLHPWAIDAAEAAELARRCGPRPSRSTAGSRNSEGAGVSAQESHFWAGNTRGFRGGYAASRHYISVGPIGGRGRECSATPGTRRCATRPSWPSPERWAATPPSACSRA